MKSKASILGLNELNSCGIVSKVELNRESVMNSEQLITLITNGYFQKVKDALKEETFKDWPANQIKRVIKAAINVKQMDIFNTLLNKRIVKQCLPKMIEDLASFSAEKGYLESFQYLWSLGYFGQRSFKNILSADLFKTIDTKIVQKLLTIAVKAGHLDIVKLILAHPDVRTEDFEKESSPYYKKTEGWKKKEGLGLIFQQAYEWFLETMRSLVSTITAYFGLNVLKPAPELETKYILETYALVTAIKYGHQDIVEELLSDQDFQDKLIKGNTIDFWFLCSLMRENKNQVALSPDDQSPTNIIYLLLPVAAQNGHLTIVNRLLKIKCIEENAHQAHYQPMISIVRYSALQLAAENGHVDVVDRLLKIKAVVEEESVNQESGVEEVARRAIAKAIKKGHLGVLGRLLQEEVIKDGLTVFGFDLLKEAIDYQQPEISKRLAREENVIQSILKKGEMPSVVRFHRTLDVLDILLENKEIESLVIKTKGWVFHSSGHVEITNRLLEIPGVLEEAVGNYLIAAKILKRGNETTLDLLAEKHPEFFEYMKRDVTNIFSGTMTPEQRNYGLLKTFFERIEKKDDQSQKVLFKAGLLSGNVQAVQDMLAQENAHSLFLGEEKESIKKAVRGGSVEVLEAILSVPSIFAVIENFSGDESDYLLQDSLEKPVNPKMVSKLLEMPVLAKKITGKWALSTVLMYHQNLFDTDVMPKLLAIPNIETRLTEDVVKKLDQSFCFCIEDIFSEKYTWMKKLKDHIQPVLRRVLNAIIVEKRSKIDVLKSKLLLASLPSTDTEETMSLDSRVELANTYIQDYCNLPHCRLPQNVYLFSFKTRAMFLEKVMMRHPWFIKYGPIIRDMCVQRDLFEGIPGLALPLEIILKIFKHCIGDEYKGDLKPLMSECLDAYPAVMMERLERKTSTLEEEKTPDMQEEREALFNGIEY